MAAKPVPVTMKSVLFGPWFGVTLRRAPGSGDPLGDALGDALGDDANAPRYIQTAHRRGYRFIGQRTQLTSPVLTAPAAPVSVPVTWEELGRTKSANQCTVLNLGKRLGSLNQDPWRDMNRVRQSLPTFDTRKRR